MVEELLLEGIEVAVSFIVEEEEVAETEKALMDKITNDKKFMVKLRKLVGESDMDDYQEELDAAIRKYLNLK